MAGRQGEFSVVFPFLSGDFCRLGDMTVGQRLDIGGGMRGAVE